MILLLTVDVEGMPLKDGRWDYSTVVEGVPFLLDLFEEFGIQSTFFVSSDVAENACETVKEVANKNHEVGCHGYNHQPLDLKSPNHQYNDLKKATETINNRLNSPVVGFRAPFCRISESTLPALIKLRYKYDSSVVPSPKLFGKYYFPKAPHEPYRPSEANIDRKGASSITEIPISTLPLVGSPLGFSFCLLLGLNVYKSMLLNYNQRILTFYFHNYDIYSIPDQARVSRFFRLPYLRRERQRARMLRELLEFLEQKFPFASHCARTIAEQPLTSENIKG